MSGHTKGPWVASVSVSDHGGWRNPEQYVEVATRERLIAMYSTASSEYPPNAENEANARLIAAAPDLLDVALMLVACTAQADEGDDFVDIGLESPLMHAAREAIAKATGVTP